MSQAQPDYSAHDPDDTDAPGLDIRAVRSTITPRHVLKFKTRFYEVLNWHQNAQVRVLIDSRSGPSADYALVAYRQGGRIRCDLTPWRSGHFFHVGVRDGPRMVSCLVERGDLRPTRAIRWKVNSLRGPTMLVNDWAPGPTYTSWYPHA